MKVIWEQLLKGVVVLLLHVLHQDLLSRFAKFFLSQFIEFGEDCNLGDLIFPVFTASALKVLHYRSAVPDASESGKKIFYFFGVKINCIFNRLYTAAAKK